MNPAHTFPDHTDATARLLVVVVILLVCMLL